MIKATYRFLLGLFIIFLLFLRVTVVHPSFLVLCLLLLLGGLELLVVVAPLLVLELLVVVVVVAPLLVLELVGDRAVAGS